MVELLDIYDELGNHIGEEERSIVHRDALWHKTIHCWLYDKEGNVFFQIRKDSGTLYTTASGHLKAGESIQEGFAREIKEEIGISIDSIDAELVSVVPFVMDKPMKDGSIFRDRVFANVYIDLYEGDYTDFQLQKEEVDGLVLVPAKDTLELFQKETGSIDGTVITCQKNKVNIEKRKIDFKEFLVNPHETAMEKYGDILKKVIEITEK